VLDELRPRARAAPRRQRLPDLLVEIFGDRAARSAVGMGSLPMNMAVETNWWSK
jgi:hypothetical protein